MSCALGMSWFIRVFPCFEVSAEGDLDGDGKTSLFTVIGQEDPVAKSIVLSKTFVTDEYE